MSCYFRQTDCFRFLQAIEPATVQLILLDPPFGTTKQVWDSKLDWSQVFEQAFRILKPTGMLVIHCSIPFNYELIRAAPVPPSHSWYWNKQGSPTNYLNANKQPLRTVEEILVWKKKTCTYYRQQIGSEPHTSSWATPTDYYGSVKQRKKTVIEGKTRTHYIEMKRSIDGFSTRPRELVELMIDSYSQKGDIVVDCFCYKGLSGLISKEKGRQWKGCDLFFTPSLLLPSA